ncbi:MAG: hypothetical protein KKC55_15805 [Gammaproteobacteria bacterium]|nr:hypothetical protein [Gammaproteobacteria bacterium]
MELTRKESVTTLASLYGSLTLTMIEKTKVRIQTKEHGGEWEDLIADQVPNGTKWSLNVMAKGTEESA